MSIKNLVGQVHRLVVILVSYVMAIANTQTKRGYVIGCNRKAMKF
jgi:hypothetical protein